MAMAAATETGGETKAGLKVALQNRPASPPVIPDLKKRPMQNLRDRPPLGAAGGQKRSRHKYWS